MPEYAEIITHCFFVQFIATLPSTVASFSLGRPGSGEPFPRDCISGHMKGPSVREWLSHSDSDPKQRWAVLSHHTRRRDEIPAVSVGFMAHMLDCFEP
jgi:hypothetical protein